MKFVVRTAIALAAVASSPAFAAGSVEDQCRAAVRAEMKGPNCRVVNPSSKTLSGDPCGIATAGTETMTYTNKVIACVKRGGPGK